MHELHVGAEKYWVLNPRDDITGEVAQPVANKAFNQIRI